MKYVLDGVAPEVGLDVWIAPSAVILGKVVLEDEANIWFGAVLRGDNEVIWVGAGSNVQENCVLHTDMGHPLLIGPNCTIGHAAILHGCSIGEGSLVGMGSLIMNGAKIGKGCLIAAGSLLTEGQEIPDGSMVMGRPAKVTRMLDGSEVTKLENSAAHYRANARRFAKGLKQKRK
ncbi:MAG: gamma carbonic anhydrase family protein [Alphaproteobacteria bacterium]|jgi:carbonic anhydrase/acetyltransferase-like protein (isoleucine patch superfamily)